MLNPKTALTGLVTTVSILTGSVAYAQQPAPTCLHGANETADQAAALGWIPTLAIVGGSRWIDGDRLLAQKRTPVKVTRLFTGSDGKTHMEEYEIPLRPQGRGTELSATVGVHDLQFRRTNQDYNLDWHQAPRKQYVVTLSGESEVELDGGRKIRLGPGHILLAEDTTGQGHISRAIGSEDRISLFITLADGATLAH